MLVYNFIYIIFKNIIFASLFGYSTGLLSSFIFAKIWVFRNNSQNKIFKSFFIFCMIYFLGGLEMSLIIYFLNYMMINHRVSWLCGTFIGALNNYLGSKYLLFKKWFRMQCESIFILYAFTSSSGRDNYNIHFKYLFFQVN